MDVLSSAFEKFGYVVLDIEKARKVKNRRAEGVSVQGRERESKGQR